MIFPAAMSLTRLFTLLGLCGVLVATVLAAAGYHLWALILLGVIVISGIALAVVNWRLS